MSVDLSQGRTAAGKPPGQVPFEAHIELLRLFLTHREEIAEGIEAVLNAQRKPIQYWQDRSVLFRRFENCFFAHTAVTAGQTRLRSELEEAHWARGFRPREVQHLHNDLIDPAEMMTRAFHCWQQTRWPGRSGRMHYAHTLFSVYVIRWLQFLSLRIWDEGLSGTGGRLREIQGVLDELWRSSPAHQPVMVRDARWLIPLAQSLITDDLAPYFEVARQVTETLPEADALEIQKAHVRILGGHLTSQIRHYCTKDNVPINAHSVVIRTRTSNALDLALLVQGLVALLKAYDRALRSGDARMRFDLAGAICQGISPDPELFLNRADLLSAYSMIEDVFISPVSKAQNHKGQNHKAMDSEDHAVYTPLGQRHVQLQKEYGELIHRLARPLRDDFVHFRPVDGGCSPYGVVFGLPTTLIEHMALKALQHDAETRFSLEDVFVDDVLDDGDASAAKLAWVNGWRKLPHVPREVQRSFDYPQQFAEDIYNRIERELGRRDSSATASDRPRTGRLHVLFGMSCSEKGAETNSNAATIPELPPRYFASSDGKIAAAQLLAWRQEGHFLVSYETAGGWIAVKKELLTEVLGTGHDARIAGLPLAAAQVLRLMCIDLAIVDHVCELP